MRREVNCYKINRMISAYIDQELSASQMQQVRAHLEVCEACASEYTSLEQTKMLLGCLKGKTPRPEIESAILTRIEHEQRLSWPQRTAAKVGSSGWLIVRRPVPVLGAAACIAAALALTMQKEPPSKIVFERGTAQPSGAVAKTPLKDVIFMHDAWDPSQRTPTLNAVPASQINPPLTLR